MATQGQLPPPTLLPIATPLPPGWTEHIAQGGQRYYFNAFTQESTYIRPLPVSLPPPQVLSSDASKKKKEKPKQKTPIPGTDWLRVKTTEGNVFYTNKSKKESVWAVPDEIKDNVEALEKQEKEDEERRIEDGRLAEEQRLEEEEAERKRRAEEKVLKRKAMAEPEPLDEVEVVVSKKARVEDEDGSSEEEDEEEEEEWQREAAAQLAAEAEEFQKQKAAEDDAARIAEEEEREQMKKKEKERGSSTLELKMPSKVDLSLDEAKALFKVRKSSHRCYITSDLSCRLFSERKTSIHFILGILRYLCSFLTQDTSYYHPSPHERMHSMNTAVIVHAKFVQLKSKHKRRMACQKRSQTRGKNSRNC